MPNTMTWKGAWVGDGSNLSVFAYIKDDAVKYSGIVYVSTSNNIPIGSPSPDSDMSNWDVVVIDGSSGNAGSSGTSGNSGSSGTSGEAGVSGTSGTSGETGLSGSSGSSGTSGETGLSGSSGSSGTSGETGLSGSSGSSGTSGEAGISGSSGTSGEAGISGTSGTSGENGGAGTSGTSGGIGLPGTSGTSGEVGSSGTSGQNGSSGSSGSTGTSGSTGSSGSSGMTGTSGTSGAFTGTLTFTQGTDIPSAATINDYNISSGSLFSITGTTASTITGFANGSVGRYMLVVNNTDKNQTFQQENTGSLASNRLVLGVSNKTINPNQTVTLIYVGGLTIGGTSNQSRWILTAVT